MQLTALLSWHPCIECPPLCGLPTSSPSLPGILNKIQEASVSFPAATCHARHLYFLRSGTSGAWLLTALQRIFRSNSICLSGPWLPSKEMKQRRILAVCCCSLPGAAAVEATGMSRPCTAGSAVLSFESREDKARGMNNINRKFKGFVLLVCSPLKLSFVCYYG